MSCPIDADRALASDWLDALEKLHSLSRARDAPRSAVRKSLARLHRRRTEEELDRAKQDMRCLEKRLSDVGAGANPQEWGVLSTGRVRGYHEQVITLERTLDALILDEDVAIEARARAEEMRHQLPLVRGFVALGRGAALLDSLESQILELSADPSLDDRRRGLLDHLPARRRPLADSIRSLERPGPPVTLHVSESGAEPGVWRSDPPHIALKDIVVTPGMRRTGFATATLSEVFAYADHAGLPVLAMFAPADAQFSADGDVELLDARRTSYATWYSRLGFDSDGRDPSRWKIGDQMRREPAR